MSHKSGRHFLQIPGPTNVPDRVLRAIARPTMDHRGPDFAVLAKEVLTGLKDVFLTKSPVIIYPGSGTGAWEASLVNTLSPGDKVLMFETGHFATLWREVATKIGLEVDWVEGDWRHGPDPAAVYAKLADDRTHQIKAICVVHNETSTGVVSRIAEIRKQIDAARHPALLLVDTISSLGSIEYRHDAWGVDVTIGCSQKGLMLPPGISFNAVSDKALAASKTARMPRAYWDWDAMLRDNKAGYFPYTPSTNLLYGLKEALIMMKDEGLDNIVARHERFGRATRAAVKSWGLEIVAQNPAEFSGVLTAVIMPEGRDADAFRTIVLDRFDMSLGTGLGKLKGKVFRIGHLGDLNDLTLAGTLSGVEMGLTLAGVPHKTGGVLAALESLASESLTPVS
jgi:alanine-glyoxylate transaminase/serine-glyoxylate transaminase/serine-pyruvate transaminase